MRSLIVTLIATAALAACAESGPAPTGPTAGGGATPLQQRVLEQPHSANASGGTPTITGTIRAASRSSSVAPRRAPTSAAPSTPRPVGSRGDKGG
ncbi:hypothetical protein ACFQY5_27285 [Paeniroseomonas aquatica]|uniref:hypothetical protein n=1 Tax=Paeniroseomonas aquatica TaxID=373043 RepID=UPI00360B1E84